MTENRDSPHPGTAYVGYFKELANATNGVPGQERILAELESVRKRLPDVLGRIRCADDKEQRKVLYDQIAGELLTTGGQLLPVKYMSRAAIWLAAAAEANQKAVSSARLRDFNELSKVIRDSTTREAYKHASSFVLSTYTQSDWLATWIGTEIAANARSSASAVRRALRRARFLARVRWIVPRATYFIWSFVLLIVAVDFFIDFGNKELIDLLTPYVGAAAHQIEKISKILFLLVVAWLLVDRIKPHLERWQIRLETRELQKLASDVINASFQIRIYQGLVQASFFDAESFAFPNRPKRAWLKFTLQWSVPKIESLEGLAPLTSL